MMSAHSSHASNEAESYGSTRRAFHLAVVYLFELP